MKSSLLLSFVLCIAAPASGLVMPAQAQPYVNQAQIPPTESPKAYCTRLTSFYDWFGASRSENTDGSRNMTRIEAGIECDRGNYVAGITAMENLMREKKFVPPAEPSSLAQARQQPQERQFARGPLPGPERAAQ